MADDFGDGWDEDLDDLIDDDEQQGEGGAGGDDDEGWGDGDDLDDLDVTEADEEVDQGVHQEQAIPTASNQAPDHDNSNNYNTTVDDIGWEEDEDLFSDANDFEEKSQQPPTSNQAQLQTPVAPPRQQQQQNNHKVEEVYQELVSYVQALTILLPSINAVFESEYNQPDKAHELLHYYTERPQLRAYTIEKELARMDYQVILEHEGADEPIVVDNKDEIASMFRLQPELDLLVRCANQSLLADLLQVMTGPDGLVRPQYMATCLAESCLFVIRCKPGTTGGLVDCTTNLVLSLPDPSGERYPVAKLQCNILLGIPTRPQQAPMIQFKLQTMDVIMANMEILRPTAQFLMESGLLDHPPMSPFPDTPGGGGGPIDDNDTFRDMFLQQSQTVSVGLASAWKQIDSVAGLQSKINLVKRIMPTTDGLEAAMQEQEAYQQQLQDQAQQRQAQGPGRSNHLSSSDTVPVAYPPQAGPPPPPHQHQAQSQARPSSILGSFMGRLAQSVVIPEEDPAMYDQYSGLQKSSSGDGRSEPTQPESGAFPRPPPENSAGAFPRPSPSDAGDHVASSMHLYRKDGDSGSKPKHPLVSAPSSSRPPLAPATAAQPKTSPWLNRMAESDQTTAPVPAPVPQPLVLPPPQPEMATTGEEEDLGVDDGWDDDVDVALDDDNAFEQNTEAEPVSNATRAAAASSAQPKSKEKRKIVEPTEYSKDDDIIETRKRWVNPRPGPRYLTPSLMS